jgi:hypothetical protein
MERAARKEFLTAIKKMKEGEPTNFFIRTNFQFSDAKKDNGCLIVIGNHTPAWEKVIKSAFKADKKSFLVGNVVKNDAFLYLDASKGSAKVATIQKQLKPWLKKADIKLKFEALLAPNTVSSSVQDQDTSAADQAWSNYKVEIREIAEKIKRFIAADKQLKKDLWPDLKQILPSFIQKAGTFKAKLSTSEQAIISKAQQLHAKISSKPPSPSAEMEATKNKAKEAMQELKALMEQYRTLS